MTRQIIPGKKFTPGSGSLLLASLRYGIKEFLSSIGTEKVVIGISGGIDSAVNAALYRSVIPGEKLLLVNTPSIFNSETTKPVSYTHLTLPTTEPVCRSRWSPYH